MNDQQPVPTGAEFYRRLVAALRDVGLPTTQDEIAKLLDVGQSSVSKWKNNQSYPSRATAAKAAKLTHVSLPWLYFGIGKKKENADMDELAWALMAAFDRLPTDLKRELVDFAQYKANKFPEKIEDDSPPQPPH